MEKLSLKEVLVNEMHVYYVCDASIELTESETAYGWQCVGIMAGEYYYLGDRNASLGTAIKLYQDVYGITFTEDELTQVLADNG